MDLLQIGINHRTAPLEIREKISLNTERKEKIALKLKNKQFIDEFFFLSTCNRIEFYIISKKRKRSEELILNILKEYTNIQRDKLNSYLYFNHDFSAVKHFYKVGAGLDSLVIGESQILKQIKEAYNYAKQKNITDSYLNQLFLETIRVSKKVRNETSINQRAVSVSYAAVELARDIFGSLSGEKVMILGAGETSELLLKNLVEYGVKGVLVANRTYSNGKALAKKYGGEVIHWKSVVNYINKVDIIIASTGAPHLVLNKESEKKALLEKKGPMFLIDIAVPRDINPDFKNISGVNLYNIDDLKAVVDKNMELRKREADKAEKIIIKEVEKYKNWIRKRKSIPIIKKMRKKAEKIKDKEVKRALHRLDNAEEKPEEIINCLAHRLVNKLLHKPTVSLKEIAASEKKKEEFELVKNVLLSD